jgi:capsular polysaccharide biosynthesis protein
MKIKVFSNDHSRIETINEKNNNYKFGYYCYNDVVVEIKENEITLYNTDKLFDYQQFKYKSVCQIPQKNIKNINKAAVLHCLYRDIYFHWLYDLLPQLKIKEIQSDISIITTPLIENNKYQKDSFNAFFKGINLLSKQNIYRIKKLFISINTTNSLMPHKFSFDFLKKRTQFLSSDHKDLKIYISRKGFKRSIINENALMCFLKNKGFKMYHLEDLSFIEQVILFKSCNTIISPHGSGLSNIVFCKPKTVVLEIYGPGCGERCFAKISNAMGLNYRALEVNQISYESYIHRIYYNFLSEKERFDFRINMKSFSKNFYRYIDNV